MDREMDRDKDDMQQAKDTLYSLILGIVFFGIILGVFGTLLFGAFLPDARFAFLLGSMTGVVTACGIAVHLYKTIGKSLDMEADSGSNYMKRMALLRLLLMGLPVILSVLFPDVLHPLGTFMGLMGLKFGALLQPVVLRLIKKEKKVRESAE